MKTATPTPPELSLSLGETMELVGGSSLPSPPSSPKSTSAALHITKSTPRSPFLNTASSRQASTKSSLEITQTSLKASIDKSTRRDRSRLHSHRRQSTTSTTTSDDDSGSFPANFYSSVVGVQGRRRSDRSSSGRRDGCQGLRSSSEVGCNGADTNTHTGRARAGAGRHQALSERSSSYYGLRNTYGPLPERSASYNDVWSDESSLDGIVEAGDDATIVASGNSSKSKLAANNLDACDETVQSDLLPSEISFLPRHRRHSKSKSVLKGKKTATGTTCSSAKKRSTTAAERFALMHLWEKEDDFPKQKNHHPRSA